MSTLDDLKECFRALRGPSSRNVADEWESPYRLLGGALYSIRRGYTSLDSAHDVALPSPLPDNWVDLLLQHTTHGDNLGEENEWIHIWAASYMFTNAVYRIASATEKVAGLAAGRPGNGREVIGEFKDPNKPIPPGLEKARELLRDLPPSDRFATPSTTVMARADLLERARTNYPRPFPAIICAIIQADSDKHMPQYPRKTLNFDCALAMDSFLEACAILDQALSQAPLTVGGRRGTRRE